MRRGSQERINRMFDPVAAKLFPEEHYRDQAARRYALNQDGRVNPDAIPVNATYFHDEQDNALTPSTASTTVWEDAEVSNGIILPPSGVWLVVFDGAATVRNSAGASSDFRLILNGIEIASALNFAAATPANGGSYFRKVAKVAGMAGGTSIDARVQVKSTASGTTTARNGIVRLDIHRMS